MIAAWLVEARELRPYYGRAIAQLRPVVVDGLGTVAVDYSWRLYLDLAWLGSLAPLERATAIAAHEVEHLLRRHSRLTGLASHDAANVAADAEINDDIGANERLPGAYVTPASLGCADHLLAEDYLHAAVAACGTCGGGSGVGAPKSWEYAPDGGAEVTDAIRDAVACDIRAARARGDAVVPSAAMWADGVVVAPRDWRRELAAALRVGGGVGAGLGDIRVGHVSRRWREGQPLRWRVRRQRPLIGVVVDTSGSMCGAHETPAHVTAIARAAGDILVMQGDMGPTSRPSRRVPRVWLGGGGTDLRPMMDALAAVCGMVVVVTDGDTPWPDAVAVPVVVVLTAGPRDTPAYARTVVL